MHLSSPEFPFSHSVLRGYQCLGQYKALAVRCFFRYVRSGYDKVASSGGYHGKC